MANSTKFLTNISKVLDQLQYWKTWPQDANQFQMFRIRVSFKKRIFWLVQLTLKLKKSKTHTKNIWEKIPQTTKVKVLTASCRVSSKHRVSIKENKETLLQKIRKKIQILIRLSSSILKNTRLSNLKINLNSLKKLMLSLLMKSIQTKGSLKVCWRIPS